MLALVPHLNRRMAGASSSALAATRRPPLASRFPLPPSASPGVSTRRPLATRAVRRSSFGPPVALATRGGDGSGGDVTSATAERSSSCVAREAAAAPDEASLGALSSELGCTSASDPDLGKTAALRRVRTHARSNSSLNVAGVTFEGRQRVVRSLRPGDPLLFVPEPDNPFDPGAIAVRALDGASVGYVPRDCPFGFAARRGGAFGAGNEGPRGEETPVAGITLGHVQSAGPVRSDGPATAPWGVVAACYPDVLAALPVELPLGLESLGEPLPAVQFPNSASPSSSAAAPRSPSPRPSSSSALPACALSGALGARALVPVWRCSDAARKLSLDGFLPVSVCLLSALRPAQEGEEGGYDARVFGGPEEAAPGDDPATGPPASPPLRETLVAELNGWRPEHAERWLAAARRRAVSRAQAGPWRVSATDLRAVGMHRAPWGVEVIQPGDAIADEKRRPFS